VVLSRQGQELVAKYEQFTSDKMSQKYKGQSNKWNPNTQQGSAPTNYEAPAEEAKENTEYTPFEDGSTEDRFASRSSRMQTNDSTQHLSSNEAGSLPLMGKWQARRATHIDHPMYSYQEKYYSMDA